MDSVVTRLLADTERELEAINQLPPDKRFSRLLLLSLEREQIATVAYSDEMIFQRIADLPVDDLTRKVIRRLFLWTHRDEALHAQYIRGLLLQTRQTLPTAFVLATQIVGGVSGWVSAVSHHSGDRFGLRRLTAAAAIRAGRIAGRVPDGLAAELTYQGFRRFCLLNVALEKSAVLSYERILPLTEDETQREAFTRILEDERRHSQVFEVLGECLTDQDQLHTDVTPADLVKRIRAVSPWFLPADLRGIERPSPFGKGSLVRVDRGDPGQVGATVKKTLDHSGLKELVQAHPGPVAIRPSFMLGYDQRDMSNVVNPEVVEVLAKRLRSWGATDVAVLETPTIYDRFFANRSVANVATYFGFRSPHYRLVDVEQDSRPVRSERGLVTSAMCATWQDASLRIVVSKLRGDPSEIAHLSLATLGGVSERTDRYLHTDRLLDHRTATLMTLDVAPPDFAVVDAWAPVADGPLGVMGCSTPNEARRIYAGLDAFSVDSAVLDDLGFPDPFISTFFREADQWFGSSSRPLKVEGEPGPIEHFRAPHASWWYRLISATAAPIYLHFPGRGSLFVPAMDTKAFPPVTSPPLLVRSVRRGIQKLFGLYPPVNRR